ncbi:MAG TPA: hypothetical protein VEI52_01475 [Terriglobales bacterium]|nr:hypothetical protein [Terriglobales bacterium]
MKNFARLSRRPVVCLLTTTIALAAQTIPSELYTGLRWRLIGPFRGGRVVAVSGVRGNSTTFYFGAVNGGVWQTSDAGVVWKPIFDGQKVASVGALAVAWSDPKVIYVGTGESDIRSDLASGDGVYKSTDGGQTWANLGLGDTRQISKIVIDPKRADIVYVAALGHAYGPNAERGVFKSSDGGARWTKALDLGPDIGASDLAMAIDHPQIIFATTWHARRPPWSTYAPRGGPGGGLYRSRDGGQSWSRLTAGLPEGDWSRSGVAVSSDGLRVYALIDAKKPGLYRSSDGGDSWTLANSDRRLTARSWYFSSITIDPQNPDVLYVPNVALYRSEDGGKTISIVRGAPGGDDYHQIWVDPQDSSRMILGTDQGTTISVNRGETWSTWYNQPTAQLYHVITDDKFPYSVYGNQQDSGAIAVPSRTDHRKITNRDSFSASGSESGYIAPDPDDSNILYVSALNGRVSRFDLRTSLGQDITPWPLPSWGSQINERKYRAPWTPVLVFSPVDKKTLYFGTQFVMKTVDGGLHWEAISPDLTGATPKKPDANPQAPPTVENAKQQGYGVVFTIAPSPLNRDLIWAGSDTGLIHLTHDGGKTWQDVTPKELSAWSKIVMIEASHFDPAEAYAAVDRHRLDDQTPYLYRTRDYGASWQRITKGIDAPYYYLRAVREDPRTKGLLFAGTALGLAVSFDDGDHWQSLQLNLPPSSVEDMALHGDDLVIATHGRSFWILDDITPLRQNGEAVKADEAFLYRPPTAVRVDNDSFLSTPLPPEEPTAENPPDGAILDYYLRGAAKQVQLEIFDAQHTLVRRFSSEDQEETKHPPLAIAERWLAKPQVLGETPGLHRFVWDLRWGRPSAKAVDESEDSEASLPQGPRAAPGTYQVRLTVDSRTFTESFEVRMDPRATATPAELDRQAELGRQIFAALEDGQTARDEIERVDHQLSALETKATAHPELEPAVRQLRSEIAKIMGGEPGGDLSGLKKANTGLDAALRVVESSNRAIPSQALTLYEQSNQEFKSRIAEWDRLKTTLLTQLNRHLQQAGMTPIPGGE